MCVSVLYCCSSVGCARCWWTKRRTWCDWTTWAARSSWAYSWCFSYGSSWTRCRSYWTCEKNPLNDDVACCHLSACKCIDSVRRSLFLFNPGSEMVILLPALCFLLVNMNNMFYQVILSSDSKGPGATRIQEIRGDKGARVSYSIFFLISTYNYLVRWGVGK